MPSQPAWFNRLDEILSALRSMTFTQLDRLAVEKLFRVRQRRARQIMAGLEEPRQRALDLATSDLDVDLLARRLRQAGDLRGVGGSRSGLRHSHPGQQEAGVGDRRHLVSSAGEAQRKSPWCATRASAIRRRVGPSRDALSPRSSIILVSCSRARRIHRDEHELAKPLGGTFLQQARHRRAVDQRRQTGDALDTAVVPSLPGERSPPATQCGWPTTWVISGGG